LKIQFGFEDGDSVFYNTLLSVASIFGILFGTLLGSSLSGFSRRKIIIAFNVIAMISTGMTLFLDVTMMCIGRLVFGICVGVFSAVGSIMLDETIPTSHTKLFGTATNVFLSSGVTLAMCLGAVLPDEDDVEAMKSS
jgi:MFS family permease